MAEIHDAAVGGPAKDPSLHPDLPLLPSVVASSLTGLAATVVMEQVTARLYAAEPAADREQEDRVRPGPPYRIAAERTLDALGVELGGRQLDTVGLGFHYGLGVGWAPAYPLLRRLGLGPALAGLATGLSLWAIVDEAVTPALGFSAPNEAYPLATHLRGLAGHLVYGLVVMAGVEVLDSAVRRMTR